MSLDYKWMSQGGLLLDGTGDIALTATGMETIIAMVRTRLKATVKAWQQYQIGIGLEEFTGGPSDATAQTSIQKQVASSLSTLLPSSMFTVSTLLLGSQIQIYVYIANQLIATTTVQINVNPQQG